MARSVFEGILATEGGPGQGATGPGVNTTSRAVPTGDRNQAGFDEGPDGDEFPFVRTNAPAKDKESAERLECLDDPLHMYLRQIRHLPMLTREQEAEIARCIEEAQERLRWIVMGFGFAARELAARAETVVWRQPGGRFERVFAAHKVPDREAHLRELKPLVSVAGLLNRRADERFADWQACPAPATQVKLLADFKRDEQKLRNTLARFKFNQKLTEDMMIVAEGTREKFLHSLRIIANLKAHTGSEPQAAPVEAEGRKIKALEWFVRMPCAEFLDACDEMKRSAAQAVAARNQIVEGNLRLVISLAKRYVERGVALLDLIQEGNLGLLKAIERFEPGRNCSFCSYASWWIRQAISRYIADHARIVRLPCNRIELITELMRAERRLAQELGHEPSPEEIADEMLMAVEDVRGLQLLAQQTVSIQSPVGDDENMCLGDFLQDQAPNGAFDAATLSLLKEKLAGVLCTLPERERLVLELRFGLGEGCALTLEEVGSQVRLSRERIRQIETRALDRMRCARSFRELRDVFEDYRCAAQGHP